jgi:dextranase
MAAAFDIRPARGSHAPGSPVVLLVDTSMGGEVTVEVTRLGRVVRRFSETVPSGRAAVQLGAFEEGGYAVSATLAGHLATTAFDVLANPNARPRYGFVTDFRPGRTDTAEVTDSLRAFHLTHVQFYDWMYRHAELLPPTEVYADTLGRELSLAVVRDAIGAVHAAGAQALAYAAVYGVGADYADAHPNQLVYHPDGTPWMLGDFLWIADLRPGSAWTRHLVGQMAAAVEELGFDGLHLDQYGDPKLATGADGQVVDYAAALPAYIDAVRRRLPQATLIFNNVNDFPTRTTVRAAQDVTYIEVWPPHDEHADLVDLVRRARDLAPTRPVILAAYLEPLADACGPEQLAAAKLALATTWAEGGQYLLFGERHGVLVHPYYPSYATLSEEGLATLRRFADFSVACGDLLFDPSVLEATTQLLGGLNQDVTVAGARTSSRPAAGRVWLRASTLGRRLVLQLLDFRNQADSKWNFPRQETGLCSGLQVRVRTASPDVAALFGHPMGGPGLSPVGVTMDGEDAVVALPDFDTWGVLVVDR